MLVASRVCQLQLGELAQQVEFGKGIANVGQYLRDKL